MKKILVVEDESIIAMNLEEHLTEMGYEVVGIAASGDEAIAKARELHPDLILMDIAMPGEKDGIDAAEEITSETDISIIFLTAYADEELIQRAKTVGPFGYIVKPYKDRELRAAIEVALYKRDKEALYTRLQKQKERKIMAKLREQETKIENFDSLLLEYLGLITLVILQDTGVNTPMSKKDLMKELQRKSCIPVDSATLHFSLDGLERSGIIKRREGFLSEDGLFFYLNKDVKGIKENDIYGTFLAKLTRRDERIRELEELLWSARE
ncbi:MAG: response regulator [Candidatus Methanospirareceae archaeon]